MVSSPDSLREMRHRCVTSSALVLLAFSAACSSSGGVTLPEFDAGTHDAPVVTKGADSGADVTVRADAGSNRDGAETDTRPTEDGPHPRPDSSRRDASSSDTGRHDTGRPDTGHPEGGHPIPDSAPLDVAPPPAGDAGALGYLASNLGTRTFSPSTTGPLTLTDDDCRIFTDWPDPPGLACASGQNPPTSVMAIDLPNGAGIAVVWVFTYVSIDSTSSLTVSGPNPLILVALGSVDIAGSIDASADVYDPDTDAIPGARLDGSGVGGFNNGGPQGGGGGSFCGLGGVGASGTGAIASDSAPGMAYGSANLIPLWGGSAGGGATVTSADQVNGNGGGAIQISAAGTMTLETTGYITVNGSGGVSLGDETGTGGGSGGAILLEAPTVTVDGILEANGGEGSDPNYDGVAAPDDGGVATEPGCEGGSGSQGTRVAGGGGQMAVGGGGVSAGYGGGGGGAGRIRINGTQVSVTGTVSPALGSVCASQGSLP